MANNQKPGSFTADKQANFRSGMTLQQYLSSMNSFYKEQGQVIEENLYETSRNSEQVINRKLVTYQIRQIDQENYEQSASIAEIAKNIKNKRFEDQKLGSPKQKKSLKLIPSKVDRTTYSQANQNFRVRRQSNSPLKLAKKEILNFSPNKIVSHTMQANQWRIHKEPPHSKAEITTTIYGKFLKGIHADEPLQLRIEQKQKLYKKKANQQLAEVSKYEKIVFEKQEKYLLGLRIKGVSDKICDRQVIVDRKRRNLGS